MATYTVKNGENLYDIALKLFGSIEGIFNLLVCNTEAIGETGLSLYDTLKAGTILTYTDTKVINADITKELLNSNVPVRNGEHLFEHYNFDTYIKAYVTKYNQAIVKNAIRLWPLIKDYPSASVDAKTIEDFLKYLNSYCVWSVQFVESDIQTLVGGDYSKAKDITAPERLCMPKMIVIQNGTESAITFNMKKQSVMLIDWGDNKPVDIFTLASARQERTHSYEDNGQHIISIYGNVEFTLLDLSAIGGIYYPLSEIIVSGDFYTALPNNATINRLINRT